MQIGISITKSVSFRLVQQEFSNVYHYNSPGALTGPWEALVDELVTEEKLWHASDVSFKRASVWSSGGSIAQNQMLFQKTLSGAGSTLVTTSFDRERAVLIQWPAGQDSRGKPVYLRKWYHSCGHTKGQVIGSNHLQQTAAFTDAERDAVGVSAQAFSAIGVGDAWALVAESGRGITGNPRMHKFLEHHQLGDMWR